MTIKEQFKKTYVDKAAPGTEGQRILSQMYENYEKIEQELTTKTTEIETKDKKIADLTKKLAAKESKSKTSTRKTSTKTDEPNPAA